MAIQAAGILKEPVSVTESQKALDAITDTVMEKYDEITLGRGDGRLDPSEEVSKEASAHTDKEDQTTSPEDTEDTETEETADEETDDTDEESTDEETELVSADGFVEIEGEKVPVKELIDGRFRQKDYTQKTQMVARHEDELARSREQLSRDRDDLNEHAEKVEKRGQFASHIIDLASSNSDFREELSVLLEAHDKSSLAKSASTDPEISNLKQIVGELTEKLDNFETATKQKDQDMSNEKTEENFKGSFNTIRDSKKFAHADFKEVRALVLAGDFKDLAEAMKYSHDKLQGVATAKGKKIISRKVKDQKKTPPITSGPSGQSQTSSPRPTNMNDPAFWKFAEELHDGTATL